jgi:hypothetical protein
MRDWTSFCAGWDSRWSRRRSTPIDGFLEQHRLDLLQIGAAGRLYLSGELKAVEALDDADALAASKPQIVDGKLQLEVLAEEREDAQVRRLVAHGPVTVAIFGGGHDLSDNVETLTDRCGEYIRICTTKYIEFAWE